VYNVRLVTVKIPELYLEGIDELVRHGRYSSRSEVIRTAIRDLLRRELWMPESEAFYRPKAEYVHGVKHISLTP